MISLLIVSAILFATAKMIHKDAELVDFTSMIGLVLAPAIIMFLLSLVFAAMELSPAFSFLSLLIAVTVVFFFSNSIFEWGYKRSGILAGVYLFAYIGVEVAFYAITTVNGTL